MNAGMTKPSKSDQTRSAILAAARHLFGERGYDGASVRDIAAAAKIDPAMVIRYFGGKEALFVQAADFRLGLLDVTGVPRDQLGEFLVRHFLSAWEVEGSGGSLVILLRSATSNAYAADRMREVFAGQVLPTLMRANLAGDVAERAGLISSQLLGLALGRYILRLPPLVDMLPTMIVQQVGRTIQGYLDS